MTVGEKIQFYRKQKNLSQEQLGQLLFVSRQTVSLWEKDQTTPTIDNLLKLKEIFGVSVDELLSGEAGIVQDDGHDQQEPLESFTVAYQKDDISKATMGVHKKRMTRMTVITGLLMVCFIVSLINEDIVTGGVTCGFFIFAVVLTGMNYLKLKSAIRISEQQTVNTMFDYRVYENYLEQTVSRNGEKVVTRKMQFSELLDIRQFGDLIVFRYANQLFILHTTDLNENSHFYWFLRSHINEKKKPKRKGVLTAVSVLLIVFSIASIWVALIIAAAVSGADPERFYDYLWIALCFLPISVGSVIFGMITQKKGYAYKRNMIIGLIMTVLLLIYGLLIRG